ncbi:hypothetical protein DFH07DRAFT_795665 [Mycena maculata]|uniref:Uncharacterized protein n=1 Tax=Mycena maculata TaxID=230809 RepID=A0AAD7NWG8_9AGAR|nr:hypothetical protein DFH07DRAFT_795665 [Mycena maculata]
MLMHNGFYAWLQGKNNKKLNHSKSLIKGTTISASITLSKSVDYFFCFSTLVCGQRTLEPQTCVGELFLPTGTGEVRLAGTAVLDERRSSSQLGQIKNGSNGNDPTFWFEAAFPPEDDFVRLRIRRARIIKCYGGPGKDTIDYIDPPETPFAVFQFNFVGGRRILPKPAQRVVVLRKEASAMHVNRDLGIGDKRKRGSTESDVNSSDLSSIPEFSASRSHSRETERPDISKRLRSAHEPRNIAPSSSSKGNTDEPLDIGDEYIAELEREKQLQTKLKEKLLATKQRNQKLQEMLDGDL